MKLYDYQRPAVDSIRLLYSKGKRKVILCAPTGSGKTVMFSYMAQKVAANKKKVLILTDRIELLTQTNGTLQAFNIKADIFKAGSKKIPSGAVVVAMAETIKRRLKSPAYINWFHSFNLVIADEAHKRTFDKILTHLTKEQYLIGATATPERKGRKTTQLNEFYQDIVETDNVQELISKGRLAEPKYFGNQIDLSNVRIEKGEYSKFDLERVYRRLNKSLVSNYQKHIKGLKTILFASNVANSKDAYNSFVGGGYNARHLDGTTPTKERREILSWFRAEEDAILCNANVLTTGFDEDTIKAVIIWRATTSLPLLMQMIGRGSRVREGKDQFIILDFGNNIQRHGFWEQPRKWSLTHRIGNEGIAPLKFCPNCDAVINAGLRVCNYCGAEMKIAKKYIIQELCELSRPEQEDETQTAISGQDWERLETIVEARGYKKTWILFRLAKDGERLQSYAKYKGYNKYYLNRILNRRY